MSVDERIIRAEFDNQEFERRIQTSIKSVDNLKKGLDLDNSAKSLRGLSDAGKSFSLAGISAGVDTIAGKFTNLGIIGVTALQNITNSAVNAGKQLLKSLTIDPIKTGLTEYETKMDAIQTMMTNGASRGTTLEQVNLGLAELNEYADKTIYNFAQMTDNVGKFMAADISLEDSITAIKGLSNVAAGFGVDATKMAGATYQMSQALSAGTVQLMDWKSMEQAGMGGPSLQKELVATAKSMGIVVDETVKFRDSLKDGWLTSEVFIRTMGKMANDPALTAAAQNVTTFTKLLGVMRESVQSGWAVSWEKIFGDKDQSTELFTSISNGFSSLIAPSTEARNSMLEFWNKNGGRQAIIDALSNSFDSLRSILTSVTDAFHSVFPRMTGERLVEMSVAIRDITEKFKMSDETIRKVRNTFKGFFSIIGLGGQLLSGVTNAIRDLFGSFGVDLSGFLTFTEKVGFFFTGLNIYAKQTGLFKFNIDKLKDGLSGLISFIIYYAGEAGSKIKSFFENFDGIDLTNINTALESISNNFDAFKTKMEKPAAVVKAIFEKIGDTFTWLKAKLATANISQVLHNEATGVIDFDKVLSALEKGSLITILALLSKSLMGFLTKGKSLIDSVVGVLDSVRDSLKAYQTQLKAGVILKIAASIALLAGSLILLSFIKSEKIGSSLLMISVLIGELAISMGILSRVVKANNGLSFGTLAVGMIGFATAITILSDAMIKLSTLSWLQIATASSAIAALTVEMMAMMFVLDKTKGNMLKSSLGLNAFATAIMILVDVVEKIGKIDFPVLLQGMIGLLAVFGMMTMFMALGKGAGSFSLSAGLGMIAMAASLLVIAEVLQRLGEKSWKTMIPGLIYMGIALGQLTVATALLGLVKGSFASGASMVMIAASLLVIASALEKFGELSLGVAVQGIGMIATLLGGIAVAMAAMQSALPGAAALVIVAAALTMLIVPIAALGVLPLDVIGKGLLAIAGVLVVLGLAAAVFAATGLIVVIAALGASILLFGAGLSLAGNGLLLFSAGLAALAVTGVAGGDALVKVFTKLVTLMPTLGTKLAESFLAFLSTLKTNAPAVIDSVNFIMFTLATAIRDNVPIFAQIGIDLLKALQLGIKSNITEITQNAIDIVSMFILGIGLAAPLLIESGMVTVLMFINGLSSSIEEHQPDISDAVSNLITSIGNTIAEVASTLMPSIVEAGKNITEGLKEGMYEAFPALETASKVMAYGPLDLVKDIFKIHSPSKVMEWIGKMLSLGMADGMNSGLGDIGSASGNMCTAAMIAAEKGMNSNKGQKVSLDFVSGITDGFNLGGKGAASSAAKASKSAYDATVEWIDERKYYNKLSLEEELAEWKKIQNEYKEGTEERKKADREVYRVQKELIQQSIDAKKKEFQHSKDWIDERKYYDELSLTEEIAAWERVKSRYFADAEEYKQADREIYRIRKELIQKQTEIDNERAENEKRITEKKISDIKVLNDAYENAVKTRADALYKTYSLFDSVEESTSIDGSSLVNNLENQVKAFEDWQKNISNLVKRGVVSGLIDELEELGPKTNDQIKALISLSDSELSRYVSLWNTKHQDASTQATDELSGLKSETSDKIKEIEIQADKDLESYKKVWDTKMLELTAGVSLEFSNISSSATEKIETMRNTVETEITTLTENIKTTFNDTDWASLGENLIAGIIDGIKSRTSELAIVSANMALTALNAAKNALGVQSPSKEFEMVGMYADKGFANGLFKFSNLVDDAGSSLGNKALSSLRSAISNIADVIDSDMDISPTIRPVLDLSDIQNGSKRLPAMFSTGLGINLNSSNQRITSVASNYRSNPSKIQNDSNQSNEPKYSFVQNNYSPKALSRLDIYRQTKNQFSAMKGVVTDI